MNAELTKAISTNINDNQETYDRLYVSLLDGLGTLQILIAVCNNDRQRYEIIERYEKELREEAHFLKVRLSGEELSLKSAIKTVLAKKVDETRHPVIATVLGAEQLDQKLLPQFCGYLQWTREGLRALSIPIVLWLPENLLPEIAKKAPDFWSWRNGVFIFKGEENGGVNGITLQHTSDQTYFPEASSLFSVEQLEDSLAKAIDQWGAENPKVAPFYSQVGIAYVDRFRNGKFVDREQEVIKAEEVLKKAIGLQSEPSTVLADSLNNLAGLYYAQGRYEEAEPLYKKALQLRQKLLGDRHPDVATSFNNLAALYYDQGRYEEAEPLYRQELKLRQQLFGSQHPDVATSFNNLAGLYSAQGRYDEAELLYQQALQLRQELFGDQHIDVANSLNDLALLYKDQGRYIESERLYNQAIALIKEQIGDRHPYFADSLNNIAELYRQQGRYEEAEPLYQQSLRLRRELLGNEHPKVASSLNNLAVFYSNQDQYIQAINYANQALQIHINTLGKSHFLTLETEINYLLFQLQSSLKVNQSDLLNALERLIQQEDILPSDRSSILQFLIKVLDNFSTLQEEIIKILQV